MQKKSYIYHLSSEISRDYYFFMQLLTLRIDEKTPIFFALIGFFHLFKYGNNLI